MLNTIFSYLLWACLLAGAAVIAFFIWLNTRDSKIDDKQYDPQFDPGHAVRMNAFRGTMPDDKIDPAKALRAYAQPVSRGVRVDKPESEDAPPEVPDTDPEVE